MIKVISSNVVISASGDLPHYRQIIVPRKASYNLYNRIKEPPSQVLMDINDQRTQSEGLILLWSLIRITRFSILACIVRKNHRPGCDSISLLLH